MVFCIKVPLNNINCHCVEKFVVFGTVGGLHKAKWGALVLEKLLFEGLEHRDADLGQGRRILRHET